MSFLQRKQIPLFGKNIYLDKHNRIIYFHPIQKMAYRISPENEKSLKSLQERYLISITVFFCFYAFFYRNLVASILLGIGALIIFELRLLKLLKNSTKLTLFKKQQYINTLEQQINNTTKSSLIIRSILYIILAVLLIIIVFTQPDLNNQPNSKVVGCLVAVYMVYQSFKLLYYLIKRK